MHFLNKHVKKVLLCVPLFILCLCVNLFMSLFWPMEAVAAGETGSIDVQENADLRISFTPDNKPVAGLQFSLYRVAEVSAECEYTYTSAFAGCGIDISDPDAEIYRELATMLPGYIEAGNVSADALGKTGTDGMAEIKDLPLGLYFVLGENYQTGNQYINPTPFLVSLPGLGDKGQWVYEVTSDCKYTTHSQSIDMEVLIVWKDQNFSGRPSQITMQLFAGSTLHDTVVINAQNNWKHTWEKLDGGINWDLQLKDVPEGYTVTEDRQGNRFVFHFEMNADPGTGEGGGGGQETEQTPPRLPQTGVLWWPVPILAVSGAVFLILGFLRHKGEEDEE